MRVFALLLSCLPLLAQVEPRGGSWRTWVLSNGAELRLPAPPADGSDELRWLRDHRAQLSDSAIEQVRFWDAGSPSYRWIQIMTQRIQERAIGTPPGTRQLALLNVAIYDALVAAWDSKYTHNRVGPGIGDASWRTLVTRVNVPSYPNEHAVAAGAASVIFGYIYPQESAAFDALAEEAARSRLSAGVAFPADTIAGLELGRAVGRKVVERALTDNSTAVWTGTVPTGPGLWRGTNPACPLCGEWKTWVLESAGQFRPPPPVAFNSAAKLAELEEIKAQPRTFADQARAFFWQTQEGIMTIWYDFVHNAIFEDNLEGNALRAARSYALMAVAQYDSMVACWDAKYAYWAPRPFHLDPSITTLFATPNHPSYPGAHSSNSTSIAEVIAYLFPGRAWHIRAKGLEAGVSRIWAGIHYRSDHDSGVALGNRVAALVIERALRDGSQ